MTPFVHHNVQAAAKKEASEKAKARAAAKKRSQAGEQSNDDAPVVEVNNIAEATLQRSRTVKEAQEEAAKARNVVDSQHKLTEDEEVSLQFSTWLTH